MQVLYQKSAIFNLSLVKSSLPPPPPPPLKVVGLYAYYQEAVKVTKVAKYMLKTIKTIDLEAD